MGTSFNNCVWDQDDGIAESRSSSSGNTAITEVKIAAPVVVSSTSPTPIPQPERSIFPPIPDLSPKPPYDWSLPGPSRCNLPLLSGQPDFGLYEEQDEEEED
jgi:hypothetical protein